MRKLKLQVQISIDGYIAGPNGEMDWMVWNVDARLSEYINSITDTSGTILLGRKMTDGFVTYWTNVLTNPESPEYSFAKKMVNIPKVVFTKTLKKSEWENTSLATGDLTKEINGLKQQEGKDIIVYGGANFVSNLIEANLIDEYHLFINPAALGNGRGMSIFNSRTNLKLVKSQAYECGIVVLVYEKINSK